MAIPLAMEKVWFRIDNEESERLTVFVGTLFCFAFVEDVEVGCISAFRYEMLFYSRNHSASRFSGVAAVGISAVVAGVEDFRKEVRHFFGPEIDCAESFHSGDVDYLTTLRKRYGFRKGGGVHSGVVYVGYFAGSEICVGHESIYDR